MLQEQLKPRSVRVRWKLLLLAAALCGALGVCLWCNGVFLASWQSCTVSRDLDGDGQPEELVLSRRKLVVLQDGIAVFSTVRDWKVEDILLGDINGDGAEELLLLVWKRGSYGKSRPFWVQRDETGYSQHIFIYQWNGGLKPLWMSSRLRPEVGTWSMLSDGTLHILTRGGEDTRWGYRGWGLVRLDGVRNPI